MLELTNKELHVVHCDCTNRIEKNEQLINMLLIQPEDYFIDMEEPIPESSDDDHQGPVSKDYVWINDLSTLLHERISKHHGKIYSALPLIRHKREKRLSD